MSKIYSNEVKLSATERVLVGRERVADVAYDLKIGQSTLYAWLKVAKQADRSNNSQVVKSLRQRLEEVSKERDILIKAASIFAKELY
ncbi:transposase [Pseudoalteromonas piscicida]|uniref:transposase n=1 Tax=Pseudoalteromonas piscicida TaxID=43662 RepID=UPI0027E473D1|nr:transposase [Pseudoalteromonas piscicida]WMO15697.1 transposase [Pseudoalteromonas piscicida]